MTTQQIPWWQTRGGDVGANGGNMATNIPGTCVGACSPFVTLYDRFGTADSSGVVWMSAMTGTFGVVGNNVAEGTDYKPYNTAVRTSTRREGYDYFYRLFEMGLSPAEDPELSGNEANMYKPMDGPVNGRAYWVRAGDGTGTVTIGTTWDLDPGDSMVVFVESNLTSGDVLRVNVQTFGQNDRTPEEWKVLWDDPTKSNLGLVTDEVLRLIDLQNNDFMTRMAGSGAKMVETQLDPTKGDIGLFASMMRFF
ncbi:MAG: hypothetical protein QY332_10510 [Anaerolineales bacterium]|nr:MAG: hypothetical protein QY332_10510 [Anaerolineales bacterium]